MTKEQILTLYLPLLTPIATLAIVLVGFIHNNSRLTDFRSEFRTAIVDVRSSMNDMRDMLRAEIRAADSRELLRAEFREGLATLRTEFREEFGALREDISKLRGEFAGLRGEFDVLRAEFGTLRAEFGGLRTEVERNHSELLHRIAGIETRG